MTEQEIKAICRPAVELSRREFTPAEKEMLKQAVDQSKTAHNNLVKYDLPNRT